MNMKNLGITITLVFLLIMVAAVVYLYLKKQDKNRRRVNYRTRITKTSSSDTDFYNLNNDTVYRNGIYRKVNADFKPYIEKLYHFIDDLYTKAKRYNNEINQAQYNSMVSFLNSADDIERKIRNYWNSSRFNKDFMYYIGLHYASHLLAGAIKTEQQKIKEIFVSCKRKQDQWGQKIDAAQRRQEHLHGEERRKMSAEIGEMCKIHKSISVLKGQIGAINTQYNNRVTQQNIDTAKRRDYIGTHFDERGKRWRARIMAKHQ